MRGGWASRADELDYIADSLHRTAREIEAEVNQGVAPEAERARVEKIRQNAERRREEARRLRCPVTAETIEEEVVG